MFNPYKKQNDALEEFRIKAHLRSYIKDPIIIEENLMHEAVGKLKRITYQGKDPADTIAIELLLDAYRMGFFRYDDLTDDGCELVRHGKYRRHLQAANENTQQFHTLRNRYTFAKT